MKKIFAIAITLVLALSLLAACNKGDELSGDNSTPGASSTVETFETEPEITAILPNGFRDEGGRGNETTSVFGTYYQALRMIYSLPDGLDCISTTVNDENWIWQHSDASRYVTLWQIGDSDEYGFYDGLISITSYDKPLFDYDYMLEAGLVPPGAGRSDLPKLQDYVSLFCMISDINDATQIPSSVAGMPAINVVWDYADDFVHHRCQEVWAVELPDGVCFHISTTSDYKSESSDNVEQHARWTKAVIDSIKLRDNTDSMKALETDEQGRKNVR